MIRVCPFCKCGGCAVYNAALHPREEPRYRVECSACGAKGPTKDTEREAIEKWNGALKSASTRPMDPT